MSLTLTPDWSISYPCVPAQLIVSAGQVLLLGGQPTGASGSAVWVVGLPKGNAIRQLSFENALISGMIRIDDQSVLVATRSADGVRPTGEIVALDKEGAIQWRWAAKSLSVSAPAVSGTEILVTVGGQALVQLDSVTHAEKARWALPPGVNASPAAPLVQDDFIYIACQSPHVLALSRSGEKRWQFTLPQAAPSVWLHHTPIVMGEYIYTVTSKVEVIQLNAATGELGWRVGVGSAGKALSPLATPDRRGLHEADRVGLDSQLFVGASDGVYALRPTDGKVLWHFATQRSVSVAPVVAQGIIYVGCHDHRVYALDVTTGAKRWEHEMANGIEISPALSLDNTQIFVADRKGNVAALALPLSAEQYEAAGQWAKAAEQWSAVGQSLKQARALEEWARVLAEEGHSEAEQASVWRKAAELYQAHGEHARVEACQLQAAYCRHQPILTLEIRAGTLQEKQWSKVQFIVRNVGYGLAQNIILHHDEREQFAGALEESREIYTLQPGTERADWVELCPNGHGEVPVLITVDYQDSADKACPSQTQKFFLVVAPAPESNTSIVINAGRDVNVGGDVAGRDKNTRTEG